MYENQEQDVAKKIKAAIDQENMQRAAINAGENQRFCGVAGMAPEGPYLTGSAKQARYTRADMYEKATASETLSANHNHSAAAFLRSHPEFETFLDLIKDGAITLY